MHYVLASRDSSCLRCAIPQAPRWKSLTDRYLRNASHPGMSQCAIGRGWRGALDAAFDVAAPFAGIADTGTEKLSNIFGSALLPKAFVVEIHRYVVGRMGVEDPSSPSSPSTSSIEAAGTGRSSAVERALRLPLARDCFLRRRLIVSAWKE